jgi:hypothetical protein
MATLLGAASRSVNSSEASLVPATSLWTLFDDNAASSLCSCGQLAGSSAAVITTSWMSNAVGILHLAARSRLGTRATPGSARSPRRCFRPRPTHVFVPYRAAVSCVPMDAARSPMAAEGADQQERDDRMPPDQGHGSPFGSGPVLTRYHAPRQGAESLAGRPAEHRAGFSPRGRLAGALRMQLRPRATARAQARQSGDFGGRESYEGHGWGAPQGPNPITQRFPLSQQWRMRDSNPRECEPNTLSKSEQDRSGASSVVR